MFPQHIKRSWSTAKSSEQESSSEFEFCTVIACISVSWDLWLLLDVPFASLPFTSKNNNSPYSSHENDILIKIWYSACHVPDVNVNVGCKV